MRTLSALSLLLLVTFAAPGEAAPAPPASPFPIRGIKGLWWEGIEKYRLALPWLAEHHLNFLMLCYSSFPASGKEWRADYSPQELRDLEALAAEGKRRGVDVCLSFNPGIWSKPPLLYSGEEDFQLALRKARQVHARGISWFALCLDDINQALQPADQARFGTLQAAQVHFVNRLWGEMKALQPRPHLIFCPSAYTTADAAAHLDYIQAIGAGLDPKVLVFWTGPAVCSPGITAADARRFGEWVRRKPVVWDNYPVNDMYPWRPLVGPVKGRSADLAGAVAGFVANPMKQWHASKLPLATLALYLNDPTHYDPQRAMTEVIQSYPAGQQPALRLLVELYGSSFWGETGFPPQPRPADRAEAARLLARYQRLRVLLSTTAGLAGLWEDVRPTLEADIALLERKSRDRLKETPLRAAGDDFEGGAGSVFGYRHFDRPVNYVYAAPTGRQEMRADFALPEPLPAGALLRLVARSDDSAKRPRIALILNGAPLFEGESPFRNDAFEEKRFPVPREALRPGVDTLVVRNLEPAGVAGMPPWFMVTEAELVLTAGEGTAPHR